ncbi:ABC transporter permease [bacterium]|nr:ABC transporter permease [bacterium]
MLFRLLTSFFSIGILTVVSFLAIELAPGDPAELILGNVSTTVPRETVDHIRAFYHFNRPPLIRYLEWVGDVFRGDWGYSLKSGRKVTAELLDRLPTTLKLSFGSIVLAVITGVIVGTLSVFHENKPLDHVIRCITVFVLSLPSFLIGLLLLYVFSFRVNWTPLYGSGNIGGLILPVLALGIAQGLYYARLLRNSLIESIHREYFLAALAKGLHYRKAVIHHALRNAITPLVSVIGLRFAGLLGGVVIIETIFSLPGIGSYIFEAIASRDYTVIQGYVVCVGTAVVTMNLLADLALRLIDPRTTKSRIH